MISNKYRNKKNAVIKVIICIIIVMIMILGCFFSNAISSYFKQNTIRIVINPLTSTNSCYCEIKTDGKMIICIGELNGIDTNISSIFFNFKNREKYKIEITEEECKDIFDLADKSINYGKIENTLSFDGCYFEIYYKGINQRIYCVDGEYDNLYELFIKITELSPLLSDFKYYISGIGDFENK